MANAVRATTMGHRSPSRRSSHIMTSSGQGPSIFASINTMEDEDDLRTDSEVRNITSYYSPLNDDGQSHESPVPMSDQIPRAIIVPNPQDPVEESLRRKCAFSFMDPIQKFIARRQAPWKLILQFVKLILITVQIMIFGQFRYAHTNYFKDNHIAFEHLFLKNWDAAREINAYPPATGKYALYRKDTFYTFFDYTAGTYASVENVTVVPAQRNSSLQFCVESYKPLDDKSNNIFTQEIIGHFYETEIRCLDVPDNLLVNFTSQQFLKDKKFEIPWSLMVEMRLKLSINTITSRRLGPIKGPECFNFKLDIKFDNKDHDGQILIEMESVPERYTCPGPVYRDASEIYFIRTLSIIVGIVSLISFVLCCRALIRGQLLAREVSAFFELRYKIKLSLAEIVQFLNLWYVIICINDILIIVGTILKEIIENRRTNNDLWDLCSTCLGVGNLLVWMGMLRYLGFFQKYNVIMLTIRQSMPNLVRFTVCVSIMYAGFVFCGWVVLGPYQFKFNTLSSTSECLFSLINGDDMFATFNMVSSKGGMIWGFSRLYLYLFVIIFIYVVLSLFIAIIMDAYEVVKEHYKVGFPRSRVDSFYRAIDYDIYSKTFCEGFKPSYIYKIWAWFMIRRYGPQWQGYEREASAAAQQAQNDQHPLIT